MDSAEDRAAERATTARNRVADQAADAAHRVTDAAAKVANDAADRITGAANRASDEAARASNRAADELARAANRAKDLAAKERNDAADRLSRAANKARDEVAREMDKLHGAWAAAGAESGGQPLPRDAWEKDACEFLRFDAECLMTIQGRKDRASFTVYPEQAPKAIDFRWATGPAAGRTSLGIYEVDGGTLKIGEGGGPDAPRPTGFDTGPRAPNVVVHIFRRARA